MKSAFGQARRETVVTCGLYLFFFLWWTVFAFGWESGDPSTYSYVLGMPAWFFFSCVLGYPVVCLALWICLRLFFKEIPLDDDSESSSSDKSGDTHEREATR